MAAIVILSGSDDGDSNSGNNDNENSNGDNGNGSNGNGNGNGNSDNPPGAPTGLTATANGSSQINLTWTAPADDGGSAIIGYQIEYREGNGAWGDLEADTGKTDTDYSHNGLTAATSYSYRVYAINAIGAGPASGEAMAATESLAADPKPGVPTNFIATAGDGQVTLGWEDPTHCGNGALCSATAHQHYLEYKLASDSSWTEEGVVAGSPHTTTYIVTGLTNGMNYDFRLAVQLTGEADRGPWAELSAEPQMDSDGDGIPDTTDPDDDNDGVADTSDAFPLDACASVDSDGDGSPDTILASGSTAPSGSATCSAASLLKADVDDDSDGLIEIATRAELEKLRHNLAGSSYDDEDADTGTGDTGDTTGAPATEPANCNDGDTNTTVVLCGYELANDIDLDGIASDNISCKAGGNWIPIGGCGSDGTCGESSGNDDNPFTSILEGNGYTISNLCIEAVVESADRHDILGLFGYLRGATVRNLEIAELYIESSFTNGLVNGEENRLGALAGYVSGDSTAILNVAATDGDSETDLQGATTGDLQPVGGLVGWQDGGSITASYAAVNVAGGDGNNDWVGGLVGWQDQGSITASYGSITASYATGNVDGGDGVDRVGGLLGTQDQGSITASYATGNVDGGDGNEDWVGGLVGWQDRGSITASYATGGVDGGSGFGDWVGGLVGVLDDGSIIASFATGNVDGGEGVADNAGSLVGFQTGSSFTASYGFGIATGEIAGEAGSAKPSGVTMAAHLSGDSMDTTTYAGASWSTDVWDFGDGSQAPALKYVDGYTRGDGPDNMANTDDDTHSYTCTAASFPASLAVTCGATLLPGPAGSPQDR